MAHFPVVTLMEVLATAPNSPPAPHVHHSQGGGPKLTPVGRN